jgi:hypothetical protein
MQKPTKFSFSWLLKVIPFVKYIETVYHKAFSFDLSYSIMR